MDTVHTEIMAKGKTGRGSGVMVASSQRHTTLRVQALEVIALLTKVVEMLHRRKKPSL